jgi:hypothetical protein
MKTLVVILGLVFGTAFTINAQAQTQAKPQATSHQTTQPAAQAPTQTKSMIKTTELEKPIQENLSSQFKGWTPTQAYRLDSKGVISYEVLLKKESNEMRVYYDKMGKYLREEPVAAMTHNTSKNSSSMKHSTQTAPAQKPTTKPR